jgi:tellurite resistance protein
MSNRPIPPSIFSVGFGVAGLATVWRVGAEFHLAPGWVSDVIVGIDTLLWLTSCVLYLRYVLARPPALVRDLQDMTVGPFVALALITPVLLSADGVAPYSHAVAAVFVDGFAVLIVVLGGWFTGFWRRGGTDLDRLHPGYLLPTVAGGFVASAGAAEVGQARFAEVLLGLGLICWVIIGPIVFARLVFRPPLPDVLAPTMAIEIAPAAVASLAYFFSNGGKITLFASILAGYGLLMIAAQIPLVPRYVKLTFGLSTWAFTFSWAAVASAGLFWIHKGHVTERRVSSYLVLAAISLFISGVAAKTLLAAMRGTLLPSGAATGPVLPPQHPVSPLRPR